MKSSPFAKSLLANIFRFTSEDDRRIASRESGRLEFKEAFNFGSIDEYAKTMAAFANSTGGYLVFGVKDKPRTLIGLKSDSFDSIDPAKLTESLNSVMAPELEWEPYTHTVRDEKVGMIYVKESAHKPVLCLKTTREVQEGAIYYRYRGRSEKIKYPELRRLIDEERRRERDLWISTLERMASIGIENVGVLDAITGEVSGRGGSFLISEEILSRVKFIRSGSFDETGGHPTLKIIGEAVPIDSRLIQPTSLVPAPLHGSDILRAFLEGAPVLVPLVYVKQICFEQSYYYPIYFFVSQAEVEIEDVISEIESVQCRASTKNKLLERFRSVEVLRSGSLASKSEVAERRSLLLSKLQNKTITDSEFADNLTDALHAITHLDAQNADPTFILPLILRVALPRYFSMKSSDAGLMRRAVCHLDLIWYRPVAAAPASVKNRATVRRAVRAARPDAS